MRVAGATLAAQGELIAATDNVAEPPNLMHLRSTRLSLDTKYPKEDTKLYGSVGHTPRENLKIHIFHQDHK